MINSLLDVLVCGIAEYFISLFIAQLVELLSDATHQNI